MRLFGTNGVRGVINQDLTPELALRMGRAIGRIYGGTVALATDTRCSADMMLSAASAGIRSAGASVRYIGMVPTPALQYYVKSHIDVSGGVMITASHNPPQFNGIKCVSADGTEAGRAEEEDIEKAYAEDLPCVPAEETGAYSTASGAGEDYIDAVVSCIDAAAVRKARLTVCLDCANGASCRTSPLLLKNLGVRAITLNSDPQGEFPGRLSEPVEENLKELMSLTRHSGADLGIAHDGDADRCVFVTGKGEFVSGDKSLALIAGYILDAEKGTVVTPVSTSSLVEDVVRSHGGAIEYTAVGSPVVSRRMLETKAVFGGEENGGLIFPAMQHCRDGAMSIAKMLEFVAVNGPLDKAVRTLPAYYIEKRKVECSDKDKEAIAATLEKRASAVEICKIDGLKLIFDDSWVLLRPSGTEPIYKIFAESRDASIAKARADEYVALVRTILTDCHSQ
ncbi:MAG: phosphoglucosamine mutase [Candidatus Methanoplasma sp.]|nr:phosphoglucosamine mutase [Candidatus Methanoplasma sp.]